MEKNTTLRRSDRSFTEEPPDLSYLFVSQADRSWAIFAALEEEMIQLNDFCAITLDANKKTLHEIHTDVELLRAGKMKTIDDSGFNMSSESADWMEEFDIPRWTETNSFLVPAMCLIMLSAFLEKALKDIVNSNPHYNAPYYRRTNIGEVASLIQFLKIDCGLIFIEPVQSRNARDKCRRIRNNFAHGEWEEVRKIISGYSLPEAFAAVTRLLEAIENAVIVKEMNMEKL